MAQFLDLTGLGYFKNKLLSSALHFYTGGGTTSFVTFDFGRMKSGSSTEREIYFQIEDADGVSANNWFQINEQGLMLAASDPSSDQSSISLTSSSLQTEIVNGSDIENYQRINMDNTGASILSHASNQNGDQDRFENYAKLELQTSDSNGTFALSAYTDGSWGGDPEWSENEISIAGDPANGLTISGGSTPITINGATTVSGSISWASDPTNNNHLTRKSYVDNKFVDKTSNQTGIAGQKSWTGNQIVTGSVTQTINNATGYSTQYYDAQYKYSSGNLYSQVSVRRSSDSIYATAGSNRTISSTGLSDTSSADLSISGGYTTSTTAMTAPAIRLHTYSEGSVSSSSPYVYHDGWIVLYSGNSNSNRYFSVNHELDASETQNILKYDAEGKLSLDHDYMWGEETAHMEIFPQNGDYYIGDPTPGSYGVVSLSDIVNTITCFRGDTTYVTMYDGTKKLISEVKEGDSVLGYDVNKKDYCEAIVIKNLKTGEQMGYTCYVMEDGTTIDIHGDDNFITNVKNKSFCDEDGDYLSLCSMVKNLVEFHNKNDDTHKILKETGNTDGGVCLIHSFWTPCAEMTPRYSLYTSNGTMFVNGLLHAQSPRDTINLFRKRRFILPDNIKEIFDEISVDMSARDEALPNDRISNPEKAENIAKLNEAKVKIAVYKKKLADTDYKAMKYAEGALTEEEWLPIKEQRANWRHTVNRMEEIVAEYRPIVEEENPEMFEHDWQYKNSKWKYRQSIFDAHLEDFREWQEDIKEERQKRIEESKERSRLKAKEIKANN